MNPSWSEAYGCQVDDCYELLKSFLQAQGDILGWEAARFLGFDLEVIQPLLQRLVEDGAAAATGPAFIAGKDIPAGQNSAVTPRPIFPDIHLNAGCAPAGTGRSAGPPFPG